MLVMKLQNVIHSRRCQKKIDWKYSERLKYVFAALALIDEITVRKKSPCEECGLNNHHTLLCRGKSERSSDANISETATETEDKETVTTESNSARTKSLALYPIEQANIVGTHKKATIFLDDGSDACYLS